MLGVMLSVINLVLQAVLIILWTGCLREKQKRIDELTERLSCRSAEEYARLKKEPYRAPERPRKAIKDRWDGKETDVKGAFLTGFAVFSRHGRRRTYRTAKMSLTLSTPPVCRTSRRRTSLWLG